MKTLFHAVVAASMLVAGSALADGSSTSSSAGVKVIGPVIARELAGQTIKQVGGAAAEATRGSGSVASDADR